jgi:integrase/recombinase XerD
MDMQAPTPIQKSQNLSDKVVYQQIRHREQNVIMIKFDYNQELYARVKKLVGVEWSKTHKAWYVLDNSYYREKFKLQEVNHGETFSNKIDVKLCQENILAYKTYIQLLEQKGYSKNTLKTYTTEFLIFLKTLKLVSADSLSSKRINDYFHYCIKTLKLSENQVHSRINAVKFYYEKVLQQSKLDIQIIRPKKEKQLPRVMSFEDVQNLLGQVSNNKHYFILALTYGTGIRLSEIVNLKLTDIDINRKTLFIKRAKGKKDRVVSFPKSLIHFYELYKLEYKPNVYVFEGQYGGQYSVKSVQEVFQHAKKKANIENIKGIHSFRHSYATHLHEMGTDITSIQKLLGHNDIKTTMIYTHISQKEMQNIISPLDQLIKNKRL